MSGLSKFFAKSSKEKVASPEEAIKSLSDAVSLLEKKQEYLEKKISEELVIAKTCGMNNKRAALQALGKKKRYEKQLQQFDGTITTLEHQKDALENAATNTEVLRTMAEASLSLKKANEGINLDDVQNMMDEIQEQQDVSREIADVISTPSIGLDYDQDDLEAELIALEAGGDIEQNLPKLPEIPAGKLPKAQKDVADDEVLQELEAWAM